MMHSALYLLPHLASCQFIYVFIYFYCILYSKSQTLSVWLSVESEHRTSLLVITETVTNLPLHTLFTLLSRPLLTICRKRDGYMILYTSYFLPGIWCRGSSCLSHVFPPRNHASNFHPLFAHPIIWQRYAVVSSVYFWVAHHQLLVSPPSWPGYTPQSSFVCFDLCFFRGCWSSSLFTEP